MMRDHQVHNERPSQSGSQPAQVGRGLAGADVNSVFVVIERRAFFRDCLAQCLKSSYGLDVIAFPSVHAWINQAKAAAAALVVLCTAGKVSDEQMKEDLTVLAEADRPLPTVVLSDMEEADQIVEALHRGVRGYIPTNTSLDVAVEAMRLVKAGGIFVPASSLIAAQKLLENSDRRQQPSSIFTARQAAVVEALRMGKANKLIAYELNMCESTVKVHVRNIMKKLKAKNRTQVAYLANELMRSSDT